MLQPVSLLEQGLVAAIGHLADHVQESSGIRCDFKGEDLPHIAAADATHLYRIAQEALNNAVQHAAASQIDVSLSRSGRGFTLTIADDGSGMVERSGRGLGPGPANHALPERPARRRADDPIEAQAGNGSDVLLSRGGRGAAIW